MILGSTSVFFVGEDGREEEDDDGDSDEDGARAPAFTKRFEGLVGELDGRLFRPPLTLPIPPDAAPLLPPLPFDIELILVPSTSTKTRTGKKG